MAKRTQRCEKTVAVKKGPWSPEEDHKLVAYIQRYGIWNWSRMPKPAGLARSGKSCRLRWVNYLRPDIKRGNFGKDEEETILELHQAIGNRWSAIAARLPGRTDNEIKNYWHTHMKKRFKAGIESVHEEAKGSGDKEASKNKLSEAGQLFLVDEATKVASLKSEATCSASSSVYFPVWEFDDQKGQIAEQSVCASDVTFGELQSLDSQVWQQEPIFPCDSYINHVTSDYWSSFVVFSDVSCKWGSEVKPAAVKGDVSKSVLFDACILAKELMKMKDKKWDMMSEVRMELLSSTAGHCRANDHAQLLSKGGELVTFVWLLMAHFGIGEQFQINEGHARAKLIVGK
ncbi:hypothetical protein PS1_005062 [Malus domestica]